MSNKNDSWFHCSRCGSLFQSANGVFTRHCSMCGRNPSPAIEMPQVKHRNSPPRKQTTTDRDININGKKPIYRWLAMFVVFCSVVILVIAINIMINSSDETPITQDSLNDSNKTNMVISEEDQPLLNQAIPQCNRTISQFLSSGSPEALNQYVATPVKTAARMADFYKLNPLLSIDPNTLTLDQSAVLHLPAGKAVEFNYNSNDGLQLDTVFLQENGEWRLDWDHFVRFSMHPWALFLAGGGDAQGKFRLLARQRLADDRKKSDTISIVFYAPRVGHPNELGSQSPEFIVSRNSKNGRLLDTAFDLAKRGKRAFGLNLPSFDPEGIIRVRVKVRRTDENQERHFVLEDVVACHWYSTDEPGMEISDQPLDK